MHIVWAASLLVLATNPREGWRMVATNDGVTVFQRKAKDSAVAEVQGIGLIRAPPEEVFRAIRDYANYTKTMPYTEESKILHAEEDGRVLYVYSVIVAPLVSRRDYTIKLSDESDWRDGKGYLKVSWTLSDRGPKPRDGIVRLKLNDGYWKLEPRDGGQTTFATYYVHTDPGGALPSFIADQANTTAIPNVFASIRRSVSAKVQKTER